MTYQSTTIVGNLGRDPEMRYTASGQAVCSFSVATNRQYTNSNGEKVKETVWFRVETWGKLAETCNQYLGRGRKVLVVGRLKANAEGNPRIWDGSDGQPHCSFELNANEVKFLDNGNVHTEPSTNEPVPEDDFQF